MSDIGHTIEQLKTELKAHSLYRSIGTADDLRFFMSHHVMCVWDFMSLLKSLQRDLICQNVLWLPPVDPQAARLINDIVLDEETDRLPHREGEVYGSHFEWYLQAMEEVGCDVAPLWQAIESLRQGRDAREVVLECDLPEDAVKFTRTTIRFLKDPVHVRAAVFFHGRESVIPGMFVSMVKNLQQQGLSCDILLGYLERHIEADEEVHGPMAQLMLDKLYAADPSHREEAEHAAVAALRARQQLWDAIAGKLVG